MYAVGQDAGRVYRGVSGGRDEWAERRTGHFADDADQTRPYN